VKPYLNQSVKTDTPTNSPIPVVMLERRRSELNLVATGRCVGETLLLAAECGGGADCPAAMAA